MTSVSLWLLFLLRQILDMVQWQSTSLVCVRPWFHPHHKEKENVLTQWCLWDAFSPMIPMGQQLWDGTIPKLSLRTRACISQVVTSPP